MSDVPSSSPDATASYWCYHCNKRVDVETLDDFVVCCECNKGFVESIQPIPAAYSSPGPPLSPDLTVDDSSIGSHFLQMLRMLTHAPSPRSPTHLELLSYEDDFFRLELNNRNEIDHDEDEDEDEDEDDGDEEDEEEEEENINVNDEEEEEEEEEDLGRRNRFPLATRSRTGRNRILDWAEILMGIEDNSIEFRMESDRYTGNPADYIDDTAGYEALLQNLAEGDGGGRRGAPPAAKSAIEALETFEVGSSEREMGMVCAVCKEGMVMGEIGKKLPCGHCYHGNCIVPWLGTRNSCPVCRFQLQTDDPDYEEARKKTASTFTDSAAASSSSSSSSASSSSSSSSASHL